jgi:hypothetical protein
MLWEKCCSIYMQNKRPDISLHNNKNVTLEYVIDTALPNIENTYFFPHKVQNYMK